MMKLIGLTLCTVTAGATLSGCQAGGSPPEAAPSPQTVAACLTERRVIMYGADWCQHCTRQRQLFGEAFSAVTYVECPADPQRCLDAGISGYPTWVFPGGRRLAGVQPLATLAEAAGCPPR